MLLPLHSSTQPYNSLSQKKTLTPISIPQILALKNNLPSKIFLVESVPNRAHLNVRTTIESTKDLFLFFSREQNRGTRSDVKATGAKFSAALLQRCYFNFAGRHETWHEVQLHFRDRYRRQLITRDKGFLSSEAPHAFSRKEERRKVPFLVNLTRGESLRSCERNCL